MDTMIHSRAYKSRLGSAVLAVTGVGLGNLHQGGKEEATCVIAFSVCHDRRLDGFFEFQRRREEK